MTFANPAGGEAPAKWSALGTAGGMGPQPAR